MGDGDRRHQGPIEQKDWPERIEAVAVTPGTDPRLHGYSCEEDLARHYGFVESALLALTGELPSVHQAEAARVALAFLAPAPVSEAPAHAARIAHLCQVRPPALVGIAAVCLSEQAAALVRDGAAVLAWLNGETPDLDAEVGARDDEERSSVSRLRRALRARGVVVPGVDRDLDRTGALICVLHHCGLRSEAQLMTMVVLARLPAAVAESAPPAGSTLRSYPIDVPPFRYEESR